MVNLNLPIIKLTELQQVGWVVRNIDKSMATMWENFGIGPWKVYVTSEDMMSDTTYRGKPMKYSFKAAMAKHMVTGLEIELIEPVTGDSIYTEFLREHGEGINHLGWLKVYNLDEYKQTRQKLEKAGYPCAMGGVMYSNTTERTYVGTFGYYDTTKALNTMLEVLEVTWSDPAKGDNPPSYVFPK